LFVQQKKGVDAGIRRHAGLEPPGECMSRRAGISGGLPTPKWSGPAGPMPVYTEPERTDIDSNNRANQERANPAMRKLLLTRTALRLIDGGRVPLRDIVKPGYRFRMMGYS
jgi:hypothetical protein